jgi:hypothetical protein
MLLLRDGKDEAGRARKFLSDALETYRELGIVAYAARVAQVTA